MSTARVPNWTCDFRGFPANVVAPIVLNGKNLLLYGENGATDPRSSTPWPQVSIGSAKSALSGGLWWMFTKRTQNGPRLTNDSRFR